MEENKVSHFIRFKLFNIRKLWPALVWLSLIAAVVLLQLKFSSHSIIPAVIENRVQTVSVTETAKIRTIYVSVGDFVQEGDPLIQLDTSVIDEDIADLEAKIEADTLELELEQLSMDRQFANALHDVRKELYQANLEHEQNKVEFEILEEEMKRISVLLEQGLIDSNSVLKVKSRKAIVAKSIELAPSKINTLRDSLSYFESQKAQSEGKLKNFFMQDDSRCYSVLNPAYKKLDLLKEKRKSYTLRAQGPGVVYHLNTHIGSVVKAADSILTISPRDVSQVVAYLPEDNAHLFVKGMQVIVSSKNQNVESVNVLAKVSSISPTIEVIPSHSPEILTNSFGRKIQFELIGQHHFLPGENVYLDIITEGPSELNKATVSTKKEEPNIQI